MKNMTKSEAPVSNSGLDHIAVLGAGVLGGQIAWHSAFKGKTVAVYDPYPDALESVKVAHQTYAGIYKDAFGADAAAIEATRDRLTYHTEMAPAVGDVDLVIEAVPEVPTLKTEVYQKMAPLLDDRTLIATNSSTLLARDFAEATGRPSKYCALHFANMIWSLNVVEIMAQPGTAASTLTAATHFALEIGMVPIPVRKEQSGYVMNSWFVPLLMSSLSLVATGVASAEDVDRTFMIGNRGATMGPCGFADLVGFKTIYDIASYWGEVRNDDQLRTVAAFVKEQFLDRGLQGMMGGKGFYTYPNPAYQAPDFLDVPDVSVVPEIVKAVLLT
jgi:3-hydroxybutyryl-CoA dehydrogenase